jgi:hypothetical protein
MQNREKYKKSWCLLFNNFVFKIISDLCHILDEHNVLPAAFFLETLSKLFLKLYIFIFNCKWGFTRWQR